MYERHKKSKMQSNRFALENHVMDKRSNFVRYLYQCSSSSSRYSISSIRPSITWKFHSRLSQRNNHRFSLLIYFSPHRFTSHTRIVKKAILYISERKKCQNKKKKKSVIRTQRHHRFSLSQLHLHIHSTHRDIFRNNFIVSLLSDSYLLQLKYHR